MKTKIIYISGGEVFTPSDVRGAFEEVRKMLNLSKDTVIFGVPVDQDDVGAGKNSSVVEFLSDDAVSDDILENVEIAPMSVDVVSEKPKRGRKKKEVVIEPVVATEPVLADVETAPVVEPISPEPVVETSVAKEEIIDEPAVDAEPVRSAPILSVLGIVKPVVATTEDVVDLDKEDEEFVPKSVKKEPVLEHSVIQQVKTTCDDDACVSVETTVTETRQTDQTITVQEPLNRAPTMEDIFAELEPLKEEKIVNFGSGVSDEDEIDDDVLADDLETDATLTKMATEFAAAQDDIPEEPTTKPGKIGKLKNILPFKKSKKEESSVLGDLFGWAGIAANDDDEKFQIPSWALGNN